MRISLTLPPVNHFFVVKFCNKKHLGGFAKVLLKLSALLFLSSALSQMFIQTSACSFWWSSEGSSPRWWLCIWISLSCKSGASACGKKVGKISTCSSRNQSPVFVLEPAGRDSCGWKRANSAKMEIFELSMNGYVADAAARQESVWVIVSSTGQIKIQSQTQSCFKDGEFTIPSFTQTDGSARYESRFLILTYSSNKQFIPIPDMSWTTPKQY